MLMGWLSGCVSTPPHAPKPEQPTRLDASQFPISVPSELQRYDPDAVRDYTPLQQMAIRIYALNKKYHPSSNESFYESALMLSEKSALLVVRWIEDPSASDRTEWASDWLSIQRTPFPLYNAEPVESNPLGPQQFPALRARGTAYERNGWYYSSPKTGGVKFRYEACRVEGTTRQHYLLMVLGRPADAELLRSQMERVLAIAF